MIADLGSSRGQQFKGSEYLKFKGSKFKGSEYLFKGSEYLKYPLNYFYGISSTLTP